MRNAAAAEWLLSLVCEPEQACSVTGDLLEQGHGRGAFQFWLSVLQTASFHVLQDLRSAWGWMLWLAVLGFLEFAVVGMLVSSIVAAIIITWMRHWPYLITPNSSYIPPWGYNALVLADITAVLFIVGWDVARRSGGRELASSVASLCALGAWWALRALTFSAAPTLPPSYIRDSPHWLLTLPVIAGAIFCRRRSTRRRFGAA